MKGLLLLIGLAVAQEDLAIGKVGFRLDDWKAGGSGNVMTARVRLQNNMQTLAKDFKVSCALYPRGVATPLASVVNLGRVHRQTATASCTIDDWRT
jgi:hypothetical protein